MTEGQHLRWTIHINWKSQSRQPKRRAQQTGCTKDEGKGVFVLWMKYVSPTILCDFQILRLRSFKSLHVCFKNHQPLGRVSSYRKENFLWCQSSGWLTEQWDWRGGNLLEVWAGDNSTKIDLPVVGNDLQ